MADTYKTFNFGTLSETSSGGIGKVKATLALLVADGSGDASADVTTMSADLKALTNGSGGSLVMVVVDTTKVPTVSALRSALNNILVQAAGVMNP
jgi:hypothetical protein